MAKTAERFSQMAKTAERFSQMAKNDCPSLKRAHSSLDLIEGQGILEGLQAIFIQPDREALIVEEVKIESDYKE